MPVQMVEFQLLIRGKMVKNAFKLKLYQKLYFLLINVEMLMALISLIMSRINLSMTKVFYLEASLTL